MWVGACGEHQYRRRQREHPGGGEGGRGVLCVEAQQGMLSLVVAGIYPICTRSIGYEVHGIMGMTLPQFGTWYVQ